MRRNGGDTATSVTRRRMPSPAVTTPPPQNHHKNKNSNNEIKTTTTTTTITKHDNNSNNCNNNFSQDEEDRPPLSIVQETEVGCDSLRHDLQVSLEAAEDARERAAQATRAKHSTKQGIRRAEGMVGTRRRCSKHTILNTDGDPCQHGKPLRKSRQEAQKQSEKQACPGQERESSHLQHLFLRLVLTRGDMCTKALQGLCG